MCKLFSIVEIEDKRNAENFTKYAIPKITSVDDHGLGIMRLGENGVHIQRWLDPPVIVRKKPSKQLEKYRKGLCHQENETGRRSRNLFAIGVHGRFATCARTLENVHPFYKDGTALMHNGIISNAEKFTRTLSTCDSEALLSQYVEHNVRDNGEKLTNALNGISGYYAAIAFNDNGVIDIWRDDTASLYLAHVRDVGVVIATTAEIITETARKCKAYITGLDEILPYTVIRWTNGLSPQIGTFEKISPPVAVIPNGISVVSGEVIQKHQASVSDADQWWNKPDADQRALTWEKYGYHNPEWDIDDRPPEEKHITQEEIDAIELQKLYDQKRGGK